MNLYDGNLYAIFTRAFLDFALFSQAEAFQMDFVFVGGLLALVALTWGLAVLCDRLRERP